VGLYRIRFERAQSVRVEDKESGARLSAAMTSSSVSATLLTQAAARVIGQEHTGLLTRAKPSPHAWKLTASY